MTPRRKLPRQKGRQPASQPATAPSAPPKKKGQKERTSVISNFLIPPISGIGVGGFVGVFVLGSPFSTSLLLLSLVVVVFLFVWVAPPVQALERAPHSFDSAAPMVRSNDVVGVRAAVEKKNCMTQVRQTKRLSTSRKTEEGRAI